jgi:hypothetical protein
MREKRRDVGVDVERKSIMIIDRDADEVVKLIGAKPLPEHGTTFLSPSFSLCRVASCPEFGRGTMVAQTHKT